MRILHISEAFGGGLRTAIVNYATATPEHDHHIFARARDGHETLQVPELARYEQHTGSLVAFAARARQMAASGRYDIVHLHSSYAGALRLVMPKNIAVVYSPHCYAMEMGLTRTRRLAYWAVEKSMAQRRQLLISVSPHETAIGARLRMTMPIRFVPNAAAEHSHVAPRTAGQPLRNRPTRPTVVTVGRISAQKDPHFMAAVARLLRDVCDVVWIGDGDEGRTELMTAGVTVTGWVAADQARTLIRRADLYVHTAAWEGGPLATIEAADAGCPVISRDIPSMRSLGYPLGGSTPDDMADAVRAFFSDPGYRQHVEIVTKELSAAFSFERMTAELADAYQFAVRQLT
ncbi:glycosyltransferase family 4 protein [Williamsia sp. CHRR-6]|uniref:glycosyltransferase family 4 protein n=1 Tax=Williamsia sp. CHRR-6 TaxID=2835871 RepID=UPI001BD98C22|nr:glycosyltransferase family 4 protein [Williamsia sp. CHRR-6]MBT0565921.1 glycosyltransferase family 4 protein [Williamsia sp. CHRR-6]